MLKKNLSASKAAKKGKRRPSCLDANDEVALPALPSLPAAPQIKRLIGLDADGCPLLQMASDGGESLVRARTLVALTAEHVGRELAVTFVESDPRQPLILGVLLMEVRETRPIVRVQIAGRQVTIQAADELVLRCGEASIELSADGKIALRGNYLLSRSSGVNRIQGGSIQLN